MFIPGSPDGQPDLASSGIPNAEGPARVSATGGDPFAVRGERAAIHQFRLVLAHLCEQLSGGRIHDSKTSRGSYARNVRSVLSFKRDMNEQATSILGDGAWDVARGQFGSLAIIVRIPNLDMTIAIRGNDTLRVSKEFTCPTPAA